MCKRECVRETGLLVASESHEQTRNRLRLDIVEDETRCQQGVVGRGSPFSDVLELKSPCFSMTTCCTKECVESKSLSWVSTVAIL